MQCRQYCTACNIDSGAKGEKKDPANAADLIHTKVDNVNSMLRS